MFEVDVNGLTQQYRTKPTMNVDISGSSASIPKPLTYDYMPKNLNVVFIAETGYIPTSCNVTYDELRGWVENNIPILSIYRRIDSDYAKIITTIRLESNSLALETAVSDNFTYNSDGTFSVVQES